MRPGKRWIAAAVAVSLGIVGARPNRADGETPGPATQRTVAGEPRMNGVVHLDDEGEPVLPNPQEVAPLATDTPAGGVSTTDDAELPVPRIEAAPGGGEMIRLDERFRHRTSVQRKSANGDPGAEVHCEGPAASDTSQHREADRALGRPRRHEPGSR